MVLRLEDEMIQDLRYGVRMLRKNPGFTTIAAHSLSRGTERQLLLAGALLAVTSRHTARRRLTRWSRYDTSEPKTECGAGSAE